MALAVHSSSGCRRPPAGGRLFVLGDSHALAYRGMLRLIAEREDREVRVYFREGCAPLGLYPRRDWKDPACRGPGSAMLAEVRRDARAGDVVFLPSLRLARLSDQWGPVADEAALEAAMFSPGMMGARQLGAERAVATLAPLVERGVRVVFEAPTPIFRAPAFRCADWFNRHNPVCRAGLEMDRAVLERYRRPIFTAFGIVTSALDGVSVWDPFPILCPGRTCTALRGGRPLFFDADHLSGYANRMLVDDFARHLRRGAPPRTAPAAHAALGGAPDARAGIGGRPARVGAGSAV